MMMAAPYRDWVVIYTAPQSLDTEEEKVMLVQGHKTEHDALKAFWMAHPALRVVAIVDREWMRPVTMQINFEVK
jgi:hypothetical protein